MSTAPVSKVTHYRIRTDTGTVDGAPTWAANEDIPGSVTPGTAFRVRFSVQNTGTASDTITAPNIGRCGITADTFTNMAQVVNGADASSSADATDVTVQRLSNGTGAFASGVAGYDENESLSCAVANGKFTEAEVGIVLTGGASTAGAGGGETWTLLPQGLTNAPDNVPTFTTPDVNGTNFQHGNQLGGAGQQTANSASISMTTAADVRAKNLCVVVVACDNNGTTDGDLSEISGVTIGGAAMTKAKEFTNGNGAAQAGCTCSVWYLQPAAQINAGTTITASFTTAATSGDANSIQAREFVVGTGLTVQVANTNSGATDTVGAPTSIDCVTDNIECLRVAAHAVESGDTPAAQQYNVRFTNYTWSGWWTAGAILRCSTATRSASNVSSLVEAKISTGTGAASSPLWLGSGVDWASCYVAFKAVSVTPDLDPPRLTDADTFYAPVVGRGARALTAGALTDPDTLYAPTVQRIWPLTAGRVADPDSLYAPVVGRGARDVDPGLYSSPGTFYVPVVGRGPVGTTAGLYSSPGAFYAPVVGRAAWVLGSTLYADADSLFTPTIGRGARSLTASLYPDPESFFVPEVVGLAGLQGLTAGILTDPDTLFAPTVSSAGSATAPFYTDPDSFYSASVAQAEQALVSWASIYSPVIQDVQPGRYTDPESFYVPTVVRVGAGDQTLTATQVSDPDTFYAPTAAELEQALVSWASVYSVGAAELTASLFSDPESFYSPSVSGIAVQSLTAPRLTDPDTIYAPTLIREGALRPGLVTNLNQIYQPQVVAPGALQSLLPPLYSDPDTFFGPIFNSVAEISWVTVYGPEACLRPGRYADPETFYTAVVELDYTTVAEVSFLEAWWPGGNLGSSLYADADTFFAPEVERSSQTEAMVSWVRVYDQRSVATLTAGLVINSNIFFRPRVGERIEEGLEREKGARISGSTFSRKRWRELTKAWDAQRALEMQAAELKAKSKRRIKLDRAAKIAEHALYVAQAHDEIDVKKLRLALQAATSAAQSFQAIREAERVIAISQAMVEDEEDEEAALMLILSGGG